MPIIQEREVSAGFFESLLAVFKPIAQPPVDAVRTAGSGFISQLSQVAGQNIPKSVTGFGIPTTVTDIAQASTEIKKLNDDLNALYLVGRNLDTSVRELQAKVGFNTFNGNIDILKRR